METNFGDWLWWNNLMCEIEFDIGTVAVNGSTNVNGRQGKMWYILPLDVSVDWGYERILLSLPSFSSYGSDPTVAGRE